MFSVWDVSSPEWGVPVEGESEEPGYVNYFQVVGKQESPTLVIKVFSVCLQRKPAPFSIRSLVLWPLERSFR